MTTPVKLWVYYDGAGQVFYYDTKEEAIEEAEENLKADPRADVLVHELEILDPTRPATLEYLGNQDTNSVGLGFVSTLIWDNGKVITP